MTKLVPCP